MGVRGLSTFFNKNPEFSKPYKLHDVRVIVDGNNLLHALYFIHRINFMYGGDYEKYANAIRRYLLAYIECNINLIVVFDGGYDMSDKKLNTVLQRYKDRLSQTKYIAKYGCCSGKVLPILANEVLRAVLLKLDITFVQCDYEADDQISALANHYKCPVISADSDFYIFDLHEGFIHLESVNTTINVEIGIDGKEYKFMNCSIYHIDRFVNCFPGIDKGILPLFGTLLGNDFVKESEFDNFFSNIHQPKCKGKKIIKNCRHKKMIGLLCWLKHNTVNEAINKVITYFKKEKQESIKLLIESSINGYKFQQSNLLYVIDRQDASFLNNQLITPCGSSFPTDIVIKLHRGWYPSLFINVITHHRIFLQPQIENISLLSSYTCSIFIRQVLYGILVQHDNCEGKECHSLILEYDRHNGNLQKVYIKPIFCLESYGKLPKLNELCHLKKNCSKLILSEVLAVDLNFFSIFPGEWQLLISCIKYWLCNCEVPCPEAFIYSLLLNLLYFSMIKYKKSMGEKCNNTCSCSSMMCVLANINESELQNAFKKLEKYEENPSLSRDNPLIVSFVHSYSQLQTCILFTIYLNQLLGNIIKVPNLPKCLGGIFLYNMTKDISKRSQPNLFISELLGKNTILLKLFNILKDNLYENVPAKFIFKHNPVCKSKKKKKKGELFHRS